MVTCTDEPDEPLNFHHTIENRSGTGVQVAFHESPEAFSPNFAGYFE